MWLDVVGSWNGQEERRVAAVLPGHDLRRIDREHPELLLVLRRCLRRPFLRRSPGWRSDATVNQNSLPAPCAVSNGVERGNVSRMVALAPSATPGAAALSRCTGVAFATGFTAHVVADTLLEMSLSQSSVGGVARGARGLREDHERRVRREVGVVAVDRRRAVHDVARDDDDRIAEGRAAVGHRHAAVVDRAGGERRHVDSAQVLLCDVLWAPTCVIAIIVPSGDHAG